MKLFYSFCFLLILPVVANAQSSVTLTPDKDNSIYSEDATVSNALGENLFAGVTSTGDKKRRSLIHFNLSAIPAGAVITSVSLALTCNNMSPQSGNAGINLHKLTNDWGEGTSVNNPNGTGSPASTNDATWSSRFYNTTLWSTPGGDFSATVSGSASISQLGPLTISTSTMANDVQSWVNTPASNFGWAIVGNKETESANARRFASGNNASESDRPHLTIVYTGGLPVTLSSFSATLQQQNAFLQWKTSTEINNDFFNVEHSTDGQHYAVAGKVSGAGNSTIEHSYSFIHRNVAEGKNYYRLAQYDINGEVKYSAIAVLNKSSALGLKAGPNPVTNSLLLSGNGLVNGKQFIIRTATGEVVIKGITNNQPINVKSLNAGMYFISVQDAANNIQTKKFVKQ